jgi:peptidoglycan/LPS O-acetylase OafA/YrhL
MTSAMAPLPNRGRIRITIGWPRWSLGAATLIVVLGFIAHSALNNLLPTHTIAVTLTGWAIPFAMLMASLRSRPSN